MQLLAERYQRAVRDVLGYEADIDEDMDVYFDEPELGLMYFVLDENDPEYLRLVFGGFSCAEDLGLTDDALLEVLDTVNGNCKAAKIFLEVPDEDDEDDDGPGVKRLVTISVEAFVAAPDELPDEALLHAIVGRAVAAARSAAMELLNVVQQRQGA